MAKYYGKKIATTINLCDVHSFSISPNSRQSTAMSNEDSPNCYRML